MRISVGQIYANIHNTFTDGNQVRGIIALDLSAMTGESADSFRLGRMCRLAMPENGCEVYVYTWQGELVEELALTGADPRPGLAEAITPVSSFGLNLNGDTLELEVDGNRAWMSLRSEGEGE